MKISKIFGAIPLFLLTVFRIHAQQYNVNDAVLIDMYQNQHYAEAAEYLKQNCPEPISNPKTLNRLAYTYQMAGKSLIAESYYTRIYNQDTTNIPVLLNLALINSNRENRPKAIYYFEKAGVLDTKNFQAYKQLGRLYIESKDTLNAFKNLTKASILNPEDPNVACDLSSLMIVTKKFRQAETVLRGALPSNSTNFFLLPSNINLSTSPEEQT